MIKSYTAYTIEVDDVEAAVSELMDQLDPENNCLGSTVAIVTCYHEFATNGIIAELYRRLRFPIIGATTITLATKHNVGMLGCAILMITSDDVTFTAACSTSLAHELETPLTQMYQDALTGHEEVPKLILSAAPLMNYAGESYVDVLSRVSDGIPHFGTLAVDDSQDFEQSFVMFNDKAEKDIYCIIVASGNIEPRFIYTSFSPECILPQTATVTKSEGNLVKEVNGQPLASYLETLGLASNGKVSSMLHSVPFVFDFTDEGVPISRVLHWHDDGYGICGGLMPEGTKFSVAAWDKSDVLATTTRMLESLVSGQCINALLLYSCAARTWVSGVDISLEADKVNEIIADKIPYLFAYTGGEICPVNNKTNSFHNNMLIACAF
jgi:hypothetical protein